MKFLTTTALVVLLFAWTLTGCDSGKNRDDEENPITGTWVLVKKRLNEGTAWSEFPDNIQYIKHVTPTHFTWVHYDNETDSLIGCGGGTYKLVDNAYTEHIDYFHPQGSNQIGTTLTFKLEIKGGDWFHSGYFYIMEQDSTTGEWSPGETVYFEEVWARYKNGD